MRRHLSGVLAILLLIYVTANSGMVSSPTLATAAPVASLPTTSTEPTPSTSTDKPTDPTSTQPVTGSTQPASTTQGNTGAGAEKPVETTPPADSKPAQAPQVTPPLPLKPFPGLAEAEAAWLAASRKQLPAPVDVKGIYVSGYVAGTPQVDNLIDLVDRTELNAVVVDIKSDWGPLTYHTDNPEAIALGQQGGDIPDLAALIKKLHDHKIYVIGRLVTFKDNTLAKSKPEWMLKNTDGGVWINYGDSTWLDPTNQDAWRYAVSVGKEAAAAGIDEIQFDYVRFPSDGNMNYVVYPDLKGSSKERVIGDFLAYAREQLHPYGVFVSADVFGLVTSVGDGMGIGQHLEDAAASLDYISPMVYPSHYGPGNLGFDWPNNNPYGIVKHSMDDAVARIQAAGLKGVQMRPWLQDFTWGPRDNPAVDYGPKQVRAQIQATYDGGGKSWLLWNAANVYTEGALLPAEN